MILSGVDSDGAAALQAVKAAGGIAFAQKRETADHPDMPTAAIETGLVDRELSPKEIAHALVKIARS